ncbi:MAG: creatininase family protein [Acidiphilium sp.]
MTGMPGTKTRLDDLTSAELRDVLSLRPLVLLPLGSQEDQGAHAPMGDYRLATELATRIAATASLAGTPTLAAPTLPFGAADHFGAVPGGMALAPATFRAVLADLLEDLRRNGLDRIVILNGHGGNAPIVHEVTLGIRRAGGPIIPSFYLWKVARRLMERRTGIAPARYGHGGEPLASLALALRPDAARPDLAVPPGTAGKLLGRDIAGFGALEFEGVEIDAPVEYRELAPGSAAADATGADAVLGGAVVEELVALAARFCAHMAGRR